MDSRSTNLAEIISLFEDHGENMSDEDTDIICDEIKSLDNETYYELANMCIKLGKYQILLFVLKYNKFTHDQIETLKKTVKETKCSDDIKNAVNKYNHKKKIWD